LGLAGSILGFVVNDIALSILGSHKILGPIFFVVMLIVGHGLNIFIATLGAFVHPMRLTFVEFYKNAGFKGGGETYQPLQNLKTEDKS
jgi:V/A-type H+-transporting ATPase subunit I